MTADRAAGRAEAADEPALTAALRTRLRLTTVPLVPEISLHLAHSGSGLSRLGGRSAPYWAFAWPGGIGLARHVLDHPEIVAGRTVLDLGSGSGLVAIAAAKSGAARVIANEIDAHGAAAIALNAATNGVALDIVSDDMCADESPPNADVILGGDVFYAPDVAARIGPYLRRCQASGREIMVGDPWRADLPRESLCLLAEIDVRDVGQGPGVAAASKAAVFAWDDSAAEEAGEEALLGRRSRGGR